MRTTLKIVLPLIISVVVVSLLFAVYQVRTQKRMLRNDLSRRAEILAESLQENVEPLLIALCPTKVYSASSIALASANISRASPFTTPTAPFSR